MSVISTVCAKCLFFEMWYGRDDIGYCRCNAPVRSETECTHNAEWPVVTTKDWCGEFKALTSECRKAGLGI